MPDSLLFLHSLQTIPHHVSLSFHLNHVVEYRIFPRSSGQGEIPDRRLKSASSGFGRQDACVTGSRTDAAKFLGWSGLVRDLFHVLKSREFKAALEISGNSRKYPDMSLLGCGGFATGEGLAAAISMGAGAVAMGTRFVASKESDFPQNFKDIVPPAQAEDTVLVTGTLGPIRLWKNKYSLSHGFMSKEERLAHEKTRTNQDVVDEAKPYLAIYEGEMENAAYLLGQSAGLVDRIENVKDIIETIVNDAEKCLRNAYKTVL